MNDFEYDEELTNNAASILQNAVMQIYNFEDELEEDEEAWEKVREEEEDAFLSLMLEWQMEEESTFDDSFDLEIYHEIYRHRPVAMVADLMRRRGRERFNLTKQYWTEKHLFFSDTVFKSHYRINHSTFENLVGQLSNCQEYAGSILRGGYPVEIQVACVLWRFSNTHFGYRMINVNLGVPAGSYNNFTMRFIDAMIRISHNIIR